MNLRRGFFRLTLVLWLLVVAGLLTSMGLLLSPSPLLPFEWIGADGSSRPELPPECVDASPAEDESGLSLGAALERVERYRCDAKRARLESWEATALPAWESDAWRRNLRHTLVALGGATVLIWGLFHLLAWVGSGFRDDG